jgi:hypothetical protein
MADGDFGGDFKVDSGALASDSMHGMNTPGASDVANDDGPTLEPNGGEVGPPRQMPYSDAMQRPAQTDVGRGANRTGFVANGAAQECASTSALDDVVPAMMLGSMASAELPIGEAHSGTQYASTRSDPTGGASIFFMALFVGVALVMAAAAFRNGFGFFGLIPIMMAAVAVISIATAGSRQGNLIVATPPVTQPAQPRGNAPQRARFCAYCGRSAQGLEAGCAGCGGPIDGKPQRGRRGQG